MPPLPQISDAEWEVMKVLWDSSPRTAAEVVDALAGRRDWNPRTIKTLLNRLVRKGAVAYAVEGKRYLYRPRVAQEACVRRESQSFVRRVFAGQEASMLVNLVRDARLTPGQIAALRRILDAKEDRQ